MSGYHPSQAIVPVNSATERPSQAKHPQVYQIDFTAVASGKRIASTKRRVRWRFGFANPEALAAGQTGTACRGEEHDITLVWSITSGKRLILADGQEVHYSSGRGGVLDFSWTMRGNHVLKIVAHSAPPLSATPGFRQYDFFVDGQSFFLFPKVFRLGLAIGDPRANPSAQSSGGYNPSVQSTGGYNRNSAQIGGGGRGNSLDSIEAPHNPDEEEAYLQEAIKNSLQEAAVAPAVSQQGKDLLIDFFGNNSAAPPASAPLPLANQAHGAPDYGAQYGAPAYGAPVPAAYGNAPPTYGAPAPVAYGNAPAYPPQPAYGGPALLALEGPPAPAFAAPPAAAAWSAPAAPADPWGAQAPAAPTTPAYGAQADPWGAQPPAYGAPAPAAYGFASPQGPPAPPATVAIGASPAPSSLGFLSPQANGFASPGYHAPNQEYAPAPQAPPSYFGAAPQAAPEFGAAPEPAAPAVDPALFTMSGLSGQVEAPASADPNASLADRAYAKYANMAEFDLVSKTEPVKANPFASAPVGANLSLADMRNQPSKTAPKKSVMNAPAMPVAPTGSALVVHGAQQGNDWGQQAYGMQQPPMQQPAYGQQQPPAAYGQQPPAYGQQPPPAYGQAPPQQQQQPPPLQQPGFGQAFGQQPPPVQQNPYGGGYGQQQY